MAGSPSPDRGQPQAQSIGVAVVGGGGAGLRRIIQAIFDNSEEFHACGFYSGATSATELLADRRISLLLVAMSLPNRCGIRCAHEVKTRRPSVKVVLSTAFTDRWLLERALAVGIDAILMQPITPPQCLATLRFVACGLPLETRQPPKALLTVREEQILEDLNKGLLYKEIEERRGITHSCFRKLQQRIFRKLGAENRAEAVNKWYELIGKYHANGNVGRESNEYERYP